MKKIINKIATLPTFLQIFIDFLLLLIFSLVVVFVKNDVLKVLLILVVFIFISIVFSAMNKGYSIKYKNKMITKNDKIIFNKSFSDFKYYLAQNGFKINKEDSSLITYKKTIDDVMVNISFVDNYNNYLKYLSTIKKDEEKFDSKNDENNITSKKLKMNIYAVIFKENDFNVKEYCFNHTFTVNNFGLLFYYYEENSLNTYYNSCKEKDVIDYFNNLIGEINEK